MSDGGELEERIRNLMSRPPRTVWPKLAGSAASILLTGALASCAIVEAVAPPFRVEPKTLAGNWEGTSKGYRFRVSFTERGQAVAGTVEMERESSPRPEPPRFVFSKLGDPPTVVLPPPPPPPPPPKPPGARWTLPDTGAFGQTIPGTSGVAFKVRETDYLMTFDAWGDARLKARLTNGRPPEFNVALHKAQP
jgi:hypothetical protein